MKNFNRSTIERYFYLNPREILTKDVKYSSLRATEGSVAIQSTHTAPSCHAELVSASVQHCELPVSLARFRNKFGMTLAEPTVEQFLPLNPGKKI